MSAHPIGLCRKYDNVPFSACALRSPHAVDIGIGAVLVDVEVIETLELSGALFATTTAELCENRPRHVLKRSNDRAENLCMLDFVGLATTFSKLYKNLQKVYGN